MTGRANGSFTVTMWAIALAALAFLTVPTLVIVAVSFSASETLGFPPQGFSLRWYGALSELPEMWNAFRNSIVVAAITTSVCVILGVAAALPLASGRSRVIRALDALVMSPLVLPGIAVGLALLIFLNILHWKLSILTMIIAHIVVCTPFLIRTTVASLAQLSPSFREASISLGASELHTFANVILPMIKRGVISGAVITFLSSFDNTTVSLFLSDAGTEVLPVRLWSMIEASLDVRAAAVSTLIIAMTVVIILASEKLGGLSQAVVARSPRTEQV
jgi:putative spermidine/putrescine transport system permease protein